MELNDPIKPLAIILLVFGLVSISGCIGNNKSTEKLKISDFSYASSINGPNDYESHASEYGPNDQILMYFEVYGVHQNDGTAQIKQDLIVTGPQGETVLNKTIVNSAVDIPKDGTLRLKNVVTPPEDGFQEGTYQVKIKLKDKTAQKNIIFTDSFQISEAS
ncbi:MAG: hypothetical protein V5A68_03660 [Candidatus Thermoplasmatota archaeon]